MEHVAHRGADVGRGVAAVNGDLEGAGLLVHPGKPGAFGHVAIVGDHGHDEGLFIMGHRNPAVRGESGFHQLIARGVRVDVGEFLADTADLDVDHGNVHGHLFGCRLFHGCIFGPAAAVEAERADHTGQQI